MTYCDARMHNDIGQHTAKGRGWCFRKPGVLFVSPSVVASSSSSLEIISVSCGTAIEVRDGKTNRLSGLKKYLPKWMSSTSTHCFIIYKKVITTMVIRPFDDPTRCAQSVVTDLWPLGLASWGQAHSCRFGGGRKEAPSLVELDQVCVNSLFKEITQWLKCLLWDSNRGPSDYESSALSTAPPCHIQISPKKNKLTFS